MNENQLNRLLRLCPQFGGVFSADNIQIGETPSFILVNTDRAGLGGTQKGEKYGGGEAKTHAPN